MNFRRLMLLALLAAGVSFAPIEPLDLTFAVPLVIFVVIVFLALVGMLANTISDPKLEAWYKTELREFVAGILLVVIISGAFISSLGVTKALSGEDDFIGEAKGILDGWINVYDLAFADVIAAAGHVRLAATYAPYINVPLWYVSISYSTNPLSGLAMLLGTLNLGAQALTNAIFLAEGLRLIVAFLSVVGPKILLPLSFIIRLIPFTRRVGNTLISITLGGMVFMPFSIILVEALNDTITLPEPRVDNIGTLDVFLPLDIVSPLCEIIPLRVILGLTDPLFSLVVCLPLIVIPIVGPGLFSACYNIVFYLVYPLINVIFQLVMTGLLVTWEATLSICDAASGDCGIQGIGSQFFNELHPFFTEINNYVLVSYFDFILIATITVAGARSISAALGGEWYMAGIQRLI